ncbi:MAG: phosphoribosyltransferase [Bacteroidota bacterium]|nr:phosphoribosyltransferase [Bacteroidota bacterium]
MESKSWNEIAERIRSVQFKEHFDFIVAIANGGIIPAALLNQQFGYEVHLLKLNLRDAQQNKLYDIPRLLEEIKFDFVGKSILLVDDRIKTGTTITYAKQLLAKAASIKTFAVNGNADYCLYNEPCFKVPWLI